MDTNMQFENHGHEPLPPANLTARHPKGMGTRVLLTSVFGPYARDDECGSRRINPMELYHNQLTREPGAFSLRRFHRSWGIMMIQQNISAPCTELGLPTRESFQQELAAGLYRICRTTLEGWRRHKDDPDQRVRQRFNWEVRWLRTASTGLLWAMQQRLKKTNPAVSALVTPLRRDIGREFGLIPRLAGGLGPFLLWTARREERRLAEGVTHEPSPIVDRRNWVPTRSQPAKQGLRQGANIPFPATEPR